MAKQRGASKSRTRMSAKEPLARIERALTLTAQVEHTLRCAIHDGAFPNHRLPTVVELSEQLGVSRETVRLALDTLQNEGLLVKHRRRGTYVDPPTIPTKIASTSTVIGYLQADYSSGTGEPEVITRATSSFMFDGALVEAGNAGYQMVVRSAKIGNLRVAFDELASQARLRGVIFASVAEEKLLRRLSGLNLPTVLLDHDLHLPKISSIRPDSFERARLSVQRLVEMGHRRIVLAQWHQQDLNPWYLCGYREGMHESSLRCRRTWEINVPITPAGGAEVIDTILATSPQPTAVICFSNALASFVYDAATRHRLRVPEDLSIVGGGGGDIIGLTCTQLDWYDLGKQAMQLLLGAIKDGTQQSEHRVVPYDWKVGRTTCPPAE